MIDCVILMCFRCQPPRSHTLTPHGPPNTSALLPVLLALWPTCPIPGCSEPHTEGRGVSWLLTLSPEGKVHFTETKVGEKRKQQVATAQKKKGAGRDALRVPPRLTFHPQPPAFRFRCWAFPFLSPPWGGLPALQHAFCAAETPPLPSHAPSGYGFAP